MVRLAFVISLLSAVSLTTNAQCHTKFISELGTAADSRAKCYLLDDFARCIAQLEEGTIKNSESAKLEATSATLKVTEKCDQFESDVERRDPSVRTAEGNVDFTVDSEKDVRFIRYRREPIRLFELADQVNSLKGVVAKNLSSATSDMESIKNTLIATTATTLDNWVPKNADILNRKLAEIVSKQNGLDQDIEKGIKDLSSKKAEIQDAVMQVVTKANTATESKLTSMRTTITNLNRSIDRVVISSLKSIEACAKLGKVQIGGKCLSPEGNSKTIICKDKTDLGVSFYNVSTHEYQICIQGGPRANNSKSFTWEPLLLKPFERTPANTKADPFTGGSQVLRLLPDAKSGLFWIRPKGENTAARTWCDMGKNKGYCLAAYAHNCGTSSQSCNRLFQQLNKNNGYRWSENQVMNRQNEHGVISLPSGAMYMARGATGMMMTGSRGAVARGDADAYQYVYKIDVEGKTSGVTFQAHGKRTLGNDCGKLTVGSYTVTCTKGCGGRTNQPQSRSAFMESLGITWSDEHPTGYGFSATWGRAPCEGGGNWADGPFFPSELQRAGRYYTHQGWYGMYNGEYNRAGGMAIWFN